MANTARLNLTLLTCLLNLSLRRWDMKLVYEGTQTDTDDGQLFAFAITLQRLLKTVLTILLFPDAHRRKRHPAFLGP